MDEQVLRSMARWPSVPAVFGWLTLDRRGDWRIKQERITHRGFIEFIGRNYGSDESARWYFQNGPQRVYARIEYLPYVIRVEGSASAPRWVTHAGRAVCAIEQVWLDPAGGIIVGFDGHTGAICDRDLDQVLRHLLDESGRPADDARIETALAAAQRGMLTNLCLRTPAGILPLQALGTTDLQMRFGFVADPRPAAGQPDC